MFASKKTNKVTIENYVVTICAVSGRRLEEAARIQGDRFVVSAVRIAQTAGPALQAQLDARAKKQAEEAEEKRQAAQRTGESPTSISDAEVQAAKESRYGRYDRDTILLGGIRSWVSTDEHEKMPVVAEGVADIEETHRQTLHRAILDLTLPSIDAETLENERKNG